jgi:RNA polymerase sigma-70 factor (ECF subfamily)
MSGVDAVTLIWLLDEHSAGLVLHARQWCDAPEDIVHDAFLLLMREPSAPDNPVGWLYRVVRNKALNAARSSRRRTRHETAAAFAGEPWLTPEEGDRLDAVEAARALEDLPEEQREVIIARLWGGLSFEEIAKINGTVASTAHRRYQQGIAVLRERLEGICPNKRNNRAS